MKTVYQNLISQGRKKGHLKEALVKVNREGQEARTEAQDLERRAKERRQEAARCDEKGAEIQRELDDVEENFSEESIARFKDAVKKIEALAAKYRTNRQ